MKRFVCGALFLCLLVACGSENADRNTITIIGSATLQPVLAECSRLFEARDRKATVLIEGGGSSAGYNAIKNGQADAGTMSRALFADEKSPELVVTTLGYDGVVFIVSADNPVENLTTEQIAKIYSGEIRLWSEVGGLPEPIRAINLTSGHGTYGTVEEYLSLQGKFAADLTIMRATMQAIQSVAYDTHAISYAPYGSGFRAVTRGLPVKVLRLDDITPSPETIRDNTYPLTRPLNIVTKGAPTDLTKKFIDFVLSPVGQALLDRDEFVPVNPPEAKAE